MLNEREIASKNKKIKKLQNLLTKKYEISYTKNIEKRKQKEEIMARTNARTVEILEREREREP